MNKKKIIIIIIAILVICLIFFAIKPTSNTSNKIVNNKKTTTNGVDTNVNKEVLKDTKINELDLTDISIKYVKGTGSTYSAKITNNTDKTINVESVDATFKDKEGKEITTITLFIGGEVLPNQTNELKNTILEDISIAESVEYKIN